MWFLLARWIEAAYRKEWEGAKYLGRKELEREEEVKQLLHSGDKGLIVSGALWMTQVDDEWH